MSAAEELSPDAFCLTLLRAFSTAGAPVVVALRNLMGSWAPTWSPELLQLKENDRAPSVDFWESCITPETHTHTHTSLLL